MKNIDRYKVTFRKSDGNPFDVFYGGFGSPENILKDIMKEKSLDNITKIEFRKQIDNKYTFEKEPSFVKNMNQQLELF